MLFDDCIRKLENGELSRVTRLEVAAETAMRVLKGEHVPNGYDTREINMIAYRVLERALSDVRRADVSD